MFINKNEYYSLILGLAVYFLIFLLGVPFINRLNIYFYVFLTLIWIIYCSIGYIILFHYKSLDISYGILFIGVIIGLILNITSTFSLSDDIYRYLFDGFLIQHNINPYMYAPNNSYLSTIVSQFPYFSKINNPSISSPYPPLMIFISFIFVSVFGYNLFGWLIITNALWLFTGIFLIKILKILSVPVNYVFLWANPLVLLVFDCSGHNDIFSIFFLVIGIYFLVRSQPNSKTLLIISGCFLALSIGTKLFALLYMPFLVKKLKIGSIFTLFLTILQFIIFLLTINLKTAGITVFLLNWRGNGGLFESLFFIFNHFNSYSYNYLLQLEIRVILVILFCLSGIILFLFFRNQSSDKGLSKEKTIFEFIGYIFILFFLFIPILHPWYLLWAIFPFIIIFEKRFYPYWIFLIINSFTYYLYLNSSVVMPFLILEYCLFYGSLIEYFTNGKFTKKGILFLKRLKNVN